MGVQSFLHTPLRTPYHHALHPPPPNTTRNLLSFTASSLSLPLSSTSFSLQPIFYPSYPPLLPLIFSTCAPLPLLQPSTRKRNYHQFNPSATILLFLPICNLFIKSALRLSSRYFFSLTFLPVILSLLLILPFFLLPLLQTSFFLLLFVLLLTNSSRVNIQHPPLTNSQPKFFSYS